MKSKAGKIFGGFTMQSWNIIGDHIADEHAFIFSINSKKIYKPTNPKKAIFCNYSRGGPSFGYSSLSANGDILNEENKSECFTNGSGRENYFNIETDQNGNNEVTGEGSQY